MTNLSRFFRQRRQNQGISLGQLSRRCGYKNVTKGANKIQKFEVRGVIHPDLFQKLAIALAVTDEEIARSLSQDKAEWELWANAKIAPCLIIRLIPAVYTQKAIPSELHDDRAAMERFASDLAKEKRMKVVLVLSRRLRLWFDEQGEKYGETFDTFEKSYSPYMRLAGSGKKFLLKFE